jgi:hypothetical protein
MAAKSDLAAPMGKLFFPMMPMTRVMRPVSHALFAVCRRGNPDEPQGQNEKNSYVTKLLNMFVFMRFLRRPPRHGK